MSGVGRAPDIGRMSVALRRPGIDPRTWVSLATVEAVDWDDDNGPLATVFLMPTGTQETARLSTLYAGPGFGMYVPVEVGDDVVVNAPDGDPDNGLVITAGLHSPSAQVPAEAGANRSDFVLVVKSGQACRIFTKTSDGSGGEFEVTAEGTVTISSDSKVVLNSGTVLLGGVTALDPFLKSLTYRPAEDALFAAYAAGFTAASGGFTALLAFMQALNAGPAPTFPSIKAAAAAALAPMAATATALTLPAVAEGTFVAGDPTYLSTDVKGL